LLAAILELNFKAVWGVGGGGVGVGGSGWGVCGVRGGGGWGAGGRVWVEVWGVGWLWGVWVLVGHELFRRMFDLLLQFDCLRAKTGSVRLIDLSVCDTVGSHGTCSRLSAVPVVQHARLRPEEKPAASARRILFPGRPYPVEAARKSKKG